MPTKRKSLFLDTRTLVLHESGYKCANPACRTILTLDVHHLDPVSDDGSNSPENLIALCPNCHSLHHKGHIPKTSLRAWKMILLSLNEGFDRKSIDILLALAKLNMIYLSGDGVIECASLIASNLISSHGQVNNKLQNVTYILRLTKKGNLFISEWKQGNQNNAIGLLKNES